MRALSRILVVLWVTVCITFAGASAAASTGTRQVKAAYFSPEIGQGPAGGNVKWFQRKYRGDLGRRVVVMVT